MNLHEYQGKKILSNYNIKIQRGFLLKNKNEHQKTITKLIKLTKTKYVILKAQIHAGGRAKAGGVIVVKNIKHVFSYINKLFGTYLVTNQTSLSGKKVRKILICEDVYYGLSKNEYQEYYFSILFERSTSSIVLIYSKYGGIDIEKISRNKIYKEKIDFFLGIQDFQIRKIAYNINICNEIDFFYLKKFIKSIYKCYIHSDAILLEINPLLKIHGKDFIVVDIKIIIDDNSLFRHKNFLSMIDFKEENLLETKAKKYGLNFIKLNGDVACIVNGAGLAMATMDMIKELGFNPANFLDIGGSADSKKIKTAFKIISTDVYVKIILVNIFAGIVRCDRVVDGIIKWHHSKSFRNIPIILRLNGTNYIKAINTIKHQNIKNIFILSELNNIKNIIKKLL